VSSSSVGSETFRLTTILERSWRKKLNHNMKEGKQRKDTALGSKH
jgi:hypothetical protein